MEFSPYINTSQESYHLSHHHHHHRQTPLTIKTHRQDPGNEENAQEPQEVKGKGWKIIEKKRDNKQNS